MLDRIVGFVEQDVLEKGVLFLSGEGRECLPRGGIGLYAAQKVVIA